MTDISEANTDNPKRIDLRFINSGISAGGIKLLKAELERMYKCQDIMSWQLMTLLKERKDNRDQQLHQARRLDDVSTILSTTHCLHCLNELVENICSCDEYE